VWYARIRRFEKQKILSGAPEAFADVAGRGKDFAGIFYAFHKNRLQP
jgi:hypothetical protein